VPESIKATVTLSEQAVGGVKVDWTLGSESASRQLSNTTLGMLRDQFSEYVASGHLAPDAAAKAGIDLWDAVLPKGAGFSVLVQRRAPGQRSVIEICDSAAPSMHGLPWELLVLQRSGAAERGQENFALREDSVDLVRVMNPKPAVVATPAPRDERLRILIVTGPSEVHGVDGGEDGTIETIVQAVGAGRVSDVEIVDHLEHPRILELHESVMQHSRKSPIDLFVFRGHGTASGLAMQEARSSESPWTSAEDIALALRGHVRAAVLIACRTAAGDQDGDDRSQGNVARRLADAGIHTVAFQTDVGSSPANRFLRTLSEKLAAGQELPEAVEAARRQFADYMTQGHGLLDFASPTLWQPTPRALRLRDVRDERSPSFVESRGSAGLTVATPSGADRKFLWNNGFRVGALAAGDPEPRLLIGPDGRVVGRWDEERLTLDFAWVSRSPATAWLIGTMLSTTLPPGRVLAISRAGQDGVLVLHSTDATVTLWLAQPGAEALRVAERPGSAELGVLKGAKALLLKQVGDDADAFPGLEIEAIQAATSGGITAVLARGSVPDVGPAAWVSVGGASLQLDHPDVHLVLPLSDRERPAVRGAVDPQDLSELGAGWLTGFGSWSHDFSGAGGSGASRRPVMQRGDR
jgi:hypothetical protein